MKRNLLFNAGMTGLLIFLSSGMQAQDTAFKTLPSITITPSSAVSKEVNKSFQTSFPEAKKTTWYKMDKNYLVKFMSEDQTNRALYRNNGNLLYHIRYGQEKNLPDDVRQLVRSKYLDYNITSVMYVNQDERKIWIINVEDNKKLILVRVEEGELVQVDSYNKS